MQQIKHIPMENNLSKERPPSQLQLDSPRLPSARRSASSIDTKTSQHDLTRDASSSKLSMMVPFSWESSPGVPKDLGRRDLFSDKGLELLPPKPPPCRWHPSKEDITNDCDRDLSEGSSDYGDAFSDTFDRASLSEQLGIAGRLSSFGGLDLKDTEEMKNQSRSFIMDRFLPAANAIASSSVLKKQKRKARVELKNRETSIPQTNNGIVQMVPVPRNIEIHKEMSPRACGLMIFFPWKMKPTICGFNNLANRSRTPHANLSLLPRNNHREAQDFGLFDKKPSYRERLSQGLGLSFLDTSRSPSRETLKKLMQKDVESRSKRKREKTNRRDMGRFEENNRLPELMPPTKSWLSHAVGSTNKES